MDYKKLQPEDGHVCRTVKHVEVTGTKSAFNITLILTSMTVILSLFIIPNLVYLYNECFKLGAEIQAQKELLEFLSNSNAGIDDLEFSQNKYATKETLEIVRRFKRDDAQRVSRPSRNNRRKNANNNRNSPTTTTTEVIHLQIDVGHEKITDRENIKTGAAGEIMPYWKFSDNQFNFDQSFAELIQPEGSIKIKKDGMYFIYTQVTYYDRTGRWSHMVAINNKPFIKCLTSEWGIETDPETGQHYHTIQQCYTAAVVHINRNEKVVMKGMYSDRRIHADKDLSFWGIIKMT